MFSAQSRHDSRLRFRARTCAGAPVDSENLLVIVLEANSYRLRTPFHPTLPPTGTSGVVQPPTRECWVERIRAFGVDASPESETFRAALLLVAGLDVGPNPERISRRTGVPRPFASKCARRLIDNGVWSNGQTVGDWVASPENVDAFARDVAVAEGRLLRRIDPAGRLEWAPPGQWTKSFDGTASADALRATWIDATPRPDMPMSLAEERDGAAPLGSGDSTPAAAAPLHTHSGNGLAPHLDRDSDSALENELVETPEDATAVAGLAETAESATDADSLDSGQDVDSESDAVTPSLEEVFSQAVWLR
jgi:hypothetical protein